MLKPSGLFDLGSTPQRLVYRVRRIRDVEHLKEVLQTCWEKIGQDSRVTLSITL